ncbi:MAG: SUMF1/EgtB/PvdO family nonheme iron enzyme [Chitinophagaceae bacterium]
MKKSIAFFGLLFVAMVTVRGNNIQLSNISNTLINGNIIMQFDLTWENSWRAASTGNWDGAWVFFKFKDTDGKWKPLHFTGNNIMAPAGYTMDVSSKPGSVKTGAFIFRNTLGAGPVALTNLRAGVESIPGTFDVKGFAIEMVYVPQGSFYVGDGTGYADPGSATYADGVSNNPYRITGDGSVTQLGNTAGKLGGGFEQSLSVFLTGFPTGYNAFWMMKYELSQGGYRDFLNTLTYLQQDSLLSIEPNAAIGTRLNTLRGRVEIAVPGNKSTNTPATFGCDYLDNNIFDEAGDGEWISMAELSWSIAAAYLDWSGLRPMTELEFEKACRGPVAAVLNEFAWGTTLIASAGTYNITSGGLTSEAVSNMSNVEGNAIYRTTGPFANMRGGIFATATSSRVTAGAGYYGAMELTGSLAEFAVTTSNISGRSFTGLHGDGNMNANGMADVDFWPGINGNSDITVANATYKGSIGVTQTAGVLTRGGSIDSFNDGFHHLTISKRQAGGISNSGVLGYGIRGVRDAN